MRFRVLVLMALLLPHLPAAAAQPAPVPLEARGPDAEGAYLLAYHVERDAAATLPLRLHVLREDGSGVVESWRELGTRALPAGASRVEASFLPAEGAGEYRVRLVVESARSEPLALSVAEGGGAATRVSFEVPDEPTSLALANDSVNADGKSKNPGEVVVTRALLRDGNGVGDVRALRQRVDHAGALVEETAIPLAAAPDATEAAVEARFARAPLAAGLHRVTLLALKDEGSVASVSRTFLVRDVPPLLAGGNLSVALTGRAAALATDLVLADRNGAPGPGVLEARVYRGSSRVEGAGFAVLHEGFASARRLDDQDGHGRSSLPLRVLVPANATPGAYRVSLYADAAFVGSLPFEVRAAPALAGVAADVGNGTLRLLARGTGQGHLIAEAVDTAGARVRAEAPFGSGSGAVDLALASEVGPVRWELRLLPWPEGEPLDARNGTWAPPLAGPEVRLAPRHAGARLPAAWRVETPGWDLALANASVEVRRWDGALAPGVDAAIEGDVLRIRGPPDLEAGRYDARLRLAWPNGTHAEAAWSFEAGPWMKLALGEPQAQGREARIPLRNDGGLPVRRLVVEVAPQIASARLVLDGRTYEPREAPDGRRVFAGIDLAPGTAAELVLRLPDGPLPAGKREATVRVLALAGGG